MGGGDGSVFSLEHRFVYLGEVPSVEPFRLAAVPLVLIIFFAFLGGGGGGGVVVK